MVFRDPGPSEDCLYLNVWTPAVSAGAHLPVMVWIFGGGFQAGGTSEPRQDGENLARKGVVVVSMNYRLGVFGFSRIRSSRRNRRTIPPATMACSIRLRLSVGAQEHPGIWRRSRQRHNLRRIRRIDIRQCSNGIAAFKGFVQARDWRERRCILLGNRPVSLDQTEQAGRKFAESFGAKTLQALRAKPAGEDSEGCPAKTEAPASGRMWMDISTTKIPPPSTPPGNRRMYRYWRMERR